MNSIAAWKILTASAAMAGMTVFGIATANMAQAAPLLPDSTIGTPENCTTGGAHATHCETNGSNAIHTSPRGSVQPRVYGPYISPDMVWLVAD